MKTKRIYKPKNTRTTVGIVLVIFAVVATLLLIYAKASTPFVSLEPESVTSPTVVKGTDVNASAGGYVQFRAASQSSGTPMSLISRGIPLFTATNQQGAEAMRDSDRRSGWNSGSVPTWAAFDISGVTAAKKSAVLISIANPRTDAWISSPQQFMEIPEGYVIEANAAAGGAQPPTSGWTAIASKPTFKFSVMQETVNLTGYNWVRARFTSASAGASAVVLNIDMYSFGTVPTDDWMFMGDSITVGYALPAWSSDLAERVEAISPGRFPALFTAAYGGSNTNATYYDNTSIATPALADLLLAGFPGKYVVLGFGANDSASSFQMETLVQKVIAAGKTPVVHTMYYDQADVANNLQLNAIVQSLYTKYPQILKGPDFYGLITSQPNPTALFGDIHPSQAGIEFIRNTWANFIATQPN